MRFINCSYTDFKKAVGDRKIVLFGASSAWGYFRTVFQGIEEYLSKKLLCIVDNSGEKQGSLFRLSQTEYKIQSPAVLPGADGFVVLIDVSLAYVESICKQLEEMGLDRDTECYSLFLMTGCFGQIDNSAVDRYFSARNEKKIPAIIHSFWFSGEEKPDLYKKCLESWHKYCPDFEIREWNAENYDTTVNPYMREAYEHKKWAFVSDYARLDVIKRYGGIYMDMDVELLSSLEPYLYSDGFFCRQEDGLLELGSGFGCPKGDVMISQMLDLYHGRHLISEDGTIDMTPQPEFLSNVFCEYGFGRNHDSQEISGKIVLSNDYITCYAGKDSVRAPLLGIHWHNGGWLDEKTGRLIKESNDVRAMLCREYFIEKIGTDMGA